MFFHSVVGISVASFPTKGKLVQRVWRLKRLLQKTIDEATFDLCHLGVLADSKRVNGNAWVNTMDMGCGRACFTAVRLNVFMGTKKGRSTERDHVCRGVMKSEQVQGSHGSVCPCEAYNVTHQLRIRRGTRRRREGSSSDPSGRSASNMSKAQSPKW